MIDKNEVYCNAVETFGLDNQLTILVEECSELIKEICKIKRRNFLGVQEEGFLEELADVEIMIEQIKCYSNPYTMVKYDKIKNMKIERLIEKIKAGNN